MTPDHTDPPTQTDDARKETGSVDEGFEHIPGTARDQQGAGNTTGAEKAAANQENDPPA